MQTVDECRRNENGQKNHTKNHREPNVIYYHEFLLSVYQFTSDKLNNDLSVEKGKWYDLAVYCSVCLCQFLRP